MNGEPPAEPESRHATRSRRLLLAAILLASLLLHLNYLGHASLKPLDESFHAIVARNFLKHPFTPTLNETQYIARDIGNWQNAQVWLHKPPMAMWQIAVSYVLFGVNALALRLPSALLAAGAVGLTYLIGRELLDRRAALLAAGVQAFNPVIASLVHGYLFSDHVDISLLFWVEVSIYALVRALRTGRRIDLYLCGVAQGLAFLSKTFPALIVTGVALAVWALSRWWRQTSLSGRDVLRIVLATVVTIAPWMLWTAIRWPELFVHEHLYSLRHLNNSIEGWGGPWDRLLFDFLIRVFHVYYPAILVSLIVMSVHAWRHRDTRLMIVPVWALGVLVPHLLAESKTVALTTVGWPALFLAFGWMISRAARGDRFCLGAWLAAMLLSLFVQSHQIPASGKGYPEQPGFAIIMRQNIWVMWHIVIATAAGFVAMRWRMKPLVMRCLVALASVGMLLSGVRWWGNLDGYAVAAWRVTETNQQRPNFHALGAFARRLPPQAVLLVDEKVNLENKLIQFAADRTCYWVPQLQWESMAQRVVDAGGLPYLVTDVKMDLPAVFEDAEEGRTVYACSERAFAAAQEADREPTPHLP